ncbi:hypothetical protein LB517_19020 [Mesorhizobium sp. BR1-1-12]|uniref:hypothetical protein n=1 Tax=unclassified Mesorhizobium TaxID=325217 RepID=UPI001CD01C2B|nr:MULTISPECIES: hypothetical protein [unclassified Mesorhizobium]MBZ9919273.1 hypothetical protein [Mesorhizobium sp. BR1-1-7]MBZ9971731.1 hypothetical protein [Mesorhizobium sp. BR1-1-12]
MGWIKAAEEAAFVFVEGLIQGETPTLSASDQTKLALLACTIFSMIDLTEPEASAISFAERSHMRLTNTPPPNWHLFIGRADSLAWHMRYRHHAAISLPQGAVPRGQKSNMQVATATIGKLLLHVVSSQDLRFLTQPAAYARLLNIACLGASEVIDFNALPRLDEAALENVAERLVAEVLQPSTRF